MAQSSRFFDSSAGDRLYTAGDFADYFSGFILSNGAISGKLNSLAPTNDNTLNFTLDTGYAYFNGYMYKNSASLQLPLDAVTTGYKRIDRLVIRFDAITARSAVAYVIKGVESAGTPSAPAIGSGDQTLAQLLIDRSTGSYVYTLTDERTYASILFDQNAQVKLIKDNRHEVGDIFSNLAKKSTVGWTGNNPTTYFPAKCLTDFDTYSDVLSANSPDAVTFLRALKATYNDGLAGAVSNPVVTNWSITSNVATITFQNDAGHLALLNALGEDQTIHASYTNWRTWTANETIGSIVAGDYAITNINPSARTLTFNYTASNGSGAGTWSSSFYAFRIAGSTTSARLWSAKGKALHGVNDGDGYFATGGLRRRGYGQGHYHQHDQVAAAVGGTLVVPSGYNTVGTQTVTTARAMITDGTNGTPRIAKETNSPALTVHLYMHLGPTV